MANKKNSLKHDLISPPPEPDQKYQRQLGDAVNEMQVKRHDLNVNNGLKDGNIVATFSNLASAKNQNSLQKKLHGQIFDQNGKVKAMQPPGKPMSGTRLSKSGKKQKYTHRGAPPPDQLKGREFVLVQHNQQPQSSSAKQLVMQQAAAQQKLFASQGSLAGTQQQSAEQLHSQRMQIQAVADSAGRGEAASRYKQSQN